WTDWCGHVGTKLVDDGISVDDVMRSSIRPLVLEQRPALVAIALEWPASIYSTMSEQTVIVSGDHSTPLIDIEMTVIDFSTAGPIAFRVSGDGFAGEYEATIANGTVAFAARGQELEVSTRNVRTPLSNYLIEHQPTIILEKEAVIV